MPDQAAGLRSLFARRRPSLLIAAGGDPCKAAVAAHFAREAATAGRATVLVDGSVGQVAAACNVSCRYELAQVLSGDKPLAEVLKAVTPSLLLLPAARALASFGSFSGDEETRLGELFSSGITEAFASAGTNEAQVDLIVVNAEDGHADRALDAFGHDARIVIVASNRAASLRAAYAEVRTLSKDHGLENFEVVVPVTGDATEAGVTFTNLSNTARRFLEVELVDGGTVVVPTQSTLQALRATPLERRAQPRSAAAPLPPTLPSPHPSPQEVPHDAAVH